MRNWKKRLGNIWIIICGILLFFFQLAIIFSIYVYTKKSVVKGIVENFISEKAGSRITIDHIDYRLSPFVIKADSISYSSTDDQSETNVFLESLALYGDINKIVRTKELSFSTVKVNGARVSIKLQPVRSERSLDDFQERLRKISHLKQYVQELDVQDSSFDLTSDHYKVRLQSVRGQLTATGKRNEIDVALSSGSLSLMDPNRDFSLLTSFQGKGKIILPASPSLNADFSFGQIALNFAGERFTLDDTVFSLKGDLSSEKISLSLPNFTTRFPPFALVTGTIHWSKGRDLSFVVKPNIQVKDLDKSLQFLSSRLFPELSGFKLTGTADIEGEYSYIKGSEGISNHVDGKLRLNASKLIYIKPHLSMSNTVAGMLNFKGDRGHPDMSGFLQISKGNLDWDRLHIHNLSMKFPVSINKNLLIKIPDFHGEINKLNYQWRDENISFDQIRLEGEGSYDLKNMQLASDHLEIRIPSLSPLSLTADLSMKPSGERFFHLKSSNLDFTSLSSVFPQFLPQNISQWEPNASLDLEMSVTKPQGEMMWTTHSEIDLTDMQFQNPSFTIAGESLAPRIVLRSTYSPYHDRMPFSLEFHLEQGEFLWDDYYIDWSKNPFSAKISGMYEADRLRFPDLTADVTLPTLGKVNVHGSLSVSPQIQMNVDATASSSHLQSLYAFLSRYEDSEDVDVNLEGKVLLEFNLEKYRDFLCFQGRFKLDDGNFIRKNQTISLKGINARIPFYYQNKNIPGQDNGSNFSEEGSLSAETFNLSTFLSKPLYLEITSKANEFLLQPVTLDIFGGQAVFGETIISLASDFSNISGSSSFRMDNLDLSQIPLKSELFKFDGTAGADFPMVEIRPDHISTQGQGYIHAFDGEISIHDFGINKPFSKNRTITCDIDYSGLNLEKLTNSTPYGRVTGIIKGEIKNLAISYGQPEGFSLSLETEKSKGIPKKFSTAAIRDLEILGTGGTTSMSSAKFLSRFISEFRYSRIGIFCSLKNDVFTLRGTVKEDGTEYLVKNAWIFGISVINRKPQNQISFKDMVSRIKRIHQSQESR